MQNLTDEQLFAQLDDVLDPQFIEDPLPDDVELVEPVQGGEYCFPLPPPASDPQLPAQASQGDSSNTMRRGRKTTMKRQVIPKKKMKLMNLTWKWAKKGKFQKAVDIPVKEMARLLSPSLASEDLDSPLKFFEQFFDEDVYYPRSAFPSFQI